MGASVVQVAPPADGAQSALTTPPRDGATFDGLRHDGDGISQAAWLREMREMRREAAAERKDQTKAFVDALDTLGSKMDANFDAIRADLRRHLTGLIFTFVLALSVLAGLAGVGVWVRGMGISVTATPATAAAPVAPSVPVDPSEIPDIPVSHP